MNRNINIYCDTAKDIIPNIDNINISKIKDIINFSVDYIYCGILEHVSKHYGENYLKLILQEFSHIKQEKNIKLLYVK